MEGRSMKAKKLGRGQNWVSFYDTKAARLKRTSSFRSINNRCSNLEQARREALKSPPPSRFDEQLPTLRFDHREPTMAEILVQLG
jgi:hypothetical protein